MHTLTLIGWTGLKRAYLDVPIEDAIARYVASEGADGGEKEIERFEFVDEFICDGAAAKFSS
jgi:hypothetical protein